MKIVLASSNEHKVKEINAIVKGTGIEFILPPQGFDPIEDGNTFEENSLIKAQAAWEISKTWALADDSGLCVEALGGKPGIYSARYAETPQKRIERVLSEMSGIENRKAAFNCAMTLINPNGEVAFTYKGICEGEIIKEQRGVNGFGYDPIFLLKDSGRTMAELSDEEKNQVSHRAKALSKVIEFLINNRQEISVGNVYRHYKGNVYKIIAMAKHSETTEDMIVYQSVEHGDIWVRPKSMWNEVVDSEGTLRFTLC